jgi:hypothetical protein
VIAGNECQGQEVYKTVNTAFGGYLLVIRLRHSASVLPQFTFFLKKKDNRKASHGNRCGSKRPRVWVWQSS